MIRSKYLTGSAIVVVIIVVFSLAGIGLLCWISPWSSHSNFTPDQKSLLAKIKEQAERAGLSKSVVESIDKYDENVCYEIECLESAFEFMSGINVTVNPCNPQTWLDFVCTRRIQGMDNNLSQMDQLEGVTSNRTLELLQDERMGTTGEFLLPEAQTYYKQCISKGNQSEANVLAILDYTTSKYGGWPILTGKTPPENYFSWMDYVADQNRILRTGFKPMFLNVDTDETIDNKTVITLELGRIRFPTMKKDMNDYLKALRRIRKYGGLEEQVDTEQFFNLSKTMKGFSKTLKSLDTKPTNGTPDEYDLLTLAQLQNETNAYFSEDMMPFVQVDWKHFLERVFEGTSISFGEEDDSPQLSLPFESIMTLILMVERQMQQVQGRKNIANALHINIGTLLLQETTSLTDDLKSFQNSDEFGEMSDCMTRTTEIFGYSLGKTYMKLHYNASASEPTVRRLMDQIKESYMEMIESPPWMMGNNNLSMANSTKQFVRDKVQSMVIHVAQPEWMKQPGNLDSFYEGLKISPNSSYLQNFLGVNAWKWVKMWSAMPESQEYNWFSNLEDGYTGTSNSDYDLTTNVVYIRAGEIETPNFGMNRPGFMNYAGLGAIIGHEIGHGLDPDGRKYDKFGNDSVEHWDSISLELYNNWVSGIAKFYRSVPYDIITKEGKKMRIRFLNKNPKKRISRPRVKITTDEDVSDILGLSAAFHAYQGYLKELEGEGRKEKVLPGLKSYTSQQLFFMKYSNMWCENLDVQSLRDEVLFSSDSHSPSGRRADLPLRLSGEFKCAFNCSQTGA